MSTAEWRATLARMETRWRAVTHHVQAQRRDKRERQARAWGGVLSEMQAHQAQLVRQGEWVSGPSDLLSVIGRERRELVHCSVLAWLWTPSARHGLGERPLRWLLETLDIDPSGVAAARVRTEVSRGPVRADIVIETPDTFLVIEAKVDAVERADQCDDLFAAFQDQDGARFAFLTPAGRPPVTATGDAAVAFSTLSFRAICHALEPLAAEGGPAVRTYVDTLRSQFP